MFTCTQYLHRHRANPEKKYVRTLNPALMSGEDIHIFFFFPSLYVVESFCNGKI